METWVPIGIARTPFKTSGMTPREGGGPAHIEIYEPFVEGLAGIEKNTHVWVLGFFERAARVLTMRGRGAPADAPARGVFGMRSPMRPNPIALTPARLLRREGAILHLDRLDFYDGTAVLDIKPYSPGWDLVPSASSTHRYDPGRYTPDELRTALERCADNALGEHATRASGIIEPLVRLVFEAGVDLRDASLSFELPAPDGRADVLLCATGASFGNGRLRLGELPPGSVLAACTEDGRRLVY